MNYGVVIVTYNRIEHLKKSLELYTRQTKNPSRIIVVDNHSNDGTIDFLNSWESEVVKKKKKEVIYLPENLGGSGGFYLGKKKALELDVDWIMVADDDAYPNEDYLLGNILRIFYAV